jgi:hypothetical protein
VKPCEDTMVARTHPWQAETGVGRLWSRVDSIIVGVLQHFRPSMVTAAFIGSCSRNGRAWGTDASDLDLLVLWNDNLDGSIGPEMLKLTLEKSIPSLQVVDYWGAVSAPTVGVPVIHMHSAPASAFVDWSSLYRRAAAKYEVVHGRALAHFCPKTSLTAAELLTDPLGPLRYLAMLKNSHGNAGRWTFGGGTWQRSEIPQLAADQVDVACTVALHSARNMLRWLGSYRELSSVDLLPSQWARSGLPGLEYLLPIIDLKVARREGTLRSDSDTQAGATGMAFRFLSSQAQYLAEASFERLAG